MGIEFMGINQENMSFQKYEEQYGYGSKLGTPIIGWLILN